jgi:hypothetical protein
MDCWGVIEEDSTAAIFAIELWSRNIKDDVSICLLQQCIFCDVLVITSGQRINHEQRVTHLQLAIYSWKLRSSE